MSNFTPVLFIEDGVEHPLDTHAQPYLNNNGKAIVLSDSPLFDPIAPHEEDPQLAFGARYSGISWQEKCIASQKASYTIKEFDFQVREVRYQALWATPLTAQAFGMTLLGKEQSIHFPYPNLVRSSYRYGKWAAHQSPYLGDDRMRELLTYNPTDLEFHNFAHVFISGHQQTQPLVISVARWRPFVNEIYLADLWVKPGDALVLPPKHFPEAPPRHATPEQKWTKLVDLHGNRNSALACWFEGGSDSLLTETILANQQTMAAEATRPHYHQEQTPTVHERPPAV